MPEFDGFLNVWWYPVEGVQVKLGYNALTYFNTVGANTPVSFDYGTLDPPWNKNEFRLFDGFNMGIGFIF